MAPFIPPRVQCFVLVMASCIVSIGTLARAQSTGAAADTVYTVPGIVIEAPRLIIDDRRGSGFVATLNVGERRHRVEDLSTVLSKMIGVRVRQYGGFGSFATVSIRGSSSNQVNVYLDGVPLNDAYTGVSNIGDLPLDGIEEIEVYRGFAPPYLGSSSMGGSINLTTPQKRNRASSSPITKLEARQSYGSFETSRFSASLWSQLNVVDLFLHGGRLQSRGNFEYTDDNTTPFNPDDDGLAIRRNNDFESWSALGRVSLQTSMLGEISLSYNGLMREGGVPGVGSFQSLTARSERDNHLATLRVTPDAWVSGRLQTSINGFYSRSHERFRDPAGNIALTPQDTDNRFETFGASAVASADPSWLPVKVEAFYEARSESFRPTATLPEVVDGPERDRTTQTATASGDVLLRNGRIVLSAAGTVLSQTTEFYDAPQFSGVPPTPQGELTRTASTPRIGFRWHPSQYLTMKANWGRTFRQPTMLELFGNVGSVTGNPTLQPEEGTNRDIGVVFSLENDGWIRDVFLEVVYLQNDVDNLILFFPNSQLTSMPSNIGSARIRGWEISFSSLLFNRLRLAGNYARLDSRDQSPVPFYNGNELPGRPRDDLALFVGFAKRRWDLSYEFHWLGANYLDPANLRRVRAREIHNIAVRVRLFSGWASLSGEAKNISNDQISDINGFPLPGRSFYMTFGVTTDTGI